MTQSAFSMLRSEVHRERAAELASRMGFATDAGLYRFLVEQKLKELAELETFEEVADRAEEVADEALCETLPDSRSPFANREYQHSEPTQADSEEADPEILEWLEADEEEEEAPEEEEDNPWLEEEEKIGPELIDAGDVASDFAQAERTPQEARALIARLSPLLLSYCQPEELRAALDGFAQTKRFGALEVFQTEPCLWPSLLVAFVVRRLLERHNE